MSKQLKKQPTADVLIDIADVLASGRELPGTPPTLARLRGRGPAYFYVLSSPDEDSVPRERVVLAPFWEDLRLAAFEDLPVRAGVILDAWMLQLHPSDGKLASNSYLGTVYTTTDGRAVLTLPRAELDVALDEVLFAYRKYGSEKGAVPPLDEFLYGKGDPYYPQPIGAPCERSRPVTLSGYVWGSGTTPAAATSAAVTAAQSYADGVALAQGRREPCSAPCRGCASGSATVVPVKTTVAVGLIASAFAGAWIYQARRKFTYSFNVGCCFRGSDGTA